jgi:hypothetical protein
VLVDIGALYADEYSALGVTSWALCYQYASGVTARSSFSEEIPASLVDRGNEINRRVVETAKTRQGVPTSVVTDLWKKVGARMSAKGFGDDKIKLLTGGSIDAARYGEYCSMSEALYREIVRFPQKEAGILMRSILTDK